MSSLITTSRTDLVHARSERPHVRLTARGRTLILLILVGLLLAAFAAGRSASSGAVEQASAPSKLGQTVVQPGDTLWSVARDIAPKRDPREVVAQIRRLNGLEDAVLRVGQQLVLPAAA